MRWAIYALFALLQKQKKSVGWQEWVTIVQLDSDQCVYRDKRMVRVGVVRYSKEGPGGTIICLGAPVRYAICTSFAYKTHPRFWALKMGKKVRLICGAMRVMLKTIIGSAM